MLVQANYGARDQLRVDGVPVGKLIGVDVIPSPFDEPPAGSSIIVVIATDAPLLPVQCHRLAKRVTVGLGRVGGYGHDSSGDIFLAFSTGNHLSAAEQHRWQPEMIPMDQMTPLFHAVADATEEAILNALCRAETMTGQLGRAAHALPLDRLAEIMTSYSRKRRGGGL